MGAGVTFQRKRERERQRSAHILRGIMRARLIVSLLMFARFRASFSSGHSDPRLRLCVINHHK